MVVEGIREHSQTPISRGSALRWRFRKTKGGGKRQRRISRKSHRKNRRRAAQEVISCTPEQREISVEEVQRQSDEVHAESVPGGELPPLFNQDAPSAANCWSLRAPFSSEDDNHRLRRMTNSSPGPNGVIYRDLKTADRGSYRLAALLDAYLRLRMVV